MFPAREISAYQFLRRPWHATLAGGNATMAAIVHGLKSEEFFHQTLILAVRVGTWTGLVERPPRADRRRSESARKRPSRRG
jgi:hypothetical protein